MYFEKIHDIKEIEDLAFDIKKINEQEKNPTRSGIEKVILEIKNKYIEVAAYETSSAIVNNGVTTNISNITDDVLYSKLLPYKIILLSKIMNKYGIEEYKRIVQRYELEV